MVKSLSLSNYPISLFHSYLFKAILQPTALLSYKSLAMEPIGRFGKRVGLIKLGLDSFGFESETSYPKQITKQAESIQLHVQSVGFDQVDQYFSNNNNNNSNNNNNNNNMIFSLSSFSIQIIDPPPPPKKKTTKQK